ncbi:hypothetical protein G7Y89_g11292 [Cudoniella acicularis]|uniref:DUF6604 domain-containing protein n=1 Tax=Cudoniella acicularis TaxID=354080 RepID=A0A8H4W089_9HELO|nr:hypothetical protein G7Y89_g11292 [Cudoniella acicularis]
MLPDFLESTYIRYKKDTSIFIQRLYENWKQCGFKPAAKSVNEHTETKNEPATGRLKGKARALAKKSKTSTPDASIKKKQEEVLVNVSGLNAFAAAVASSKDILIKVPFEIMRTGLCCVSARKKYTAYFRKHMDSNAEELESSNKHSYFISAMETAILTLRPSFVTSAGTTVPDAEISSTNPKTAFEELANRFEALDVEDLNETDSGVPPPKSKHDEPIYAVEAPKDEKSI